MMMRWLKLAIFLPLLALAACATSQRPDDTGPSPRQVAISGEASDEVHWGGEIVKVKNLRDRTLIEVLAFPLNSDGRPQAGEAAEGRFIVEKSGFLEPREYMNGQLIEVRGLLKGFTDGRVGDAAYRYPVVVSERLQLWDQEKRWTGSGGPRVSPRVNIGVGSGGSQVGVGVGIGF